jgi:hypothetical protein
MVWPSRRLLINPAAFNTAKWCDIVGLVMSNRAATSPAVISSLRSMCRISRRVGSAMAVAWSAVNPVSGFYST